MALVLSEETSDHLMVSESKIEDDFNHMGDEPISIHSSIHIAGDHQGMELSGRKGAVLHEIQVHDRGSTSTVYKGGDNGGSVRVQVPNVYFDFQGRSPWSSLYSDHP